MQLPNLAWRGPRGAGKVREVRRILTAYAARLKIPFNPQPRHWQLQGGDGEGGEISTSVEESASTAKGNEKKGLLYETSMIHREFDVARMSLQDKNYIQDILGSIQGTSNILIGDNGPASHIFIFHHAHLLSEESVILLQETIERYGQVVSIFLTSEQPLPERLRDHFLEIPYSGPDNALQSLKVLHPKLVSERASWERFFEATWRKWHGTKTWTLDHVIEIRQWIYICLQRNLRWCDMVQYWTETVQAAADRGDIGAQELRGYLKCLATAKGGGGWIMLPSYRIPIAWERLLLDLTGLMEAASSTAAAAVPEKPKTTKKRATVLATSKAK